MLAKADTVCLQSQILVHMDHIMLARLLIRMQKKNEEKVTQVRDLSKYVPNAQQHITLYVICMLYRYSHYQTLPNSKWIYFIQVSALSDKHMELRRNVVCMLVLAVLERIL